MCNILSVLQECSGGAGGAESNLWTHCTFNQNMMTTGGLEMTKFQKNTTSDIKIQNIGSIEIVESNESNESNKN